MITTEKLEVNSTNTTVESVRYTNIILPRCKVLHMYSPVHVTATMSTRKFIRLYQPLLRSHIRGIHNQPMTSRRFEVYQPDVKQLICQICRRNSNISVSQNSQSDPTNQLAQKSKLGDSIVSQRMLDKVASGVQLEKYHTVRTPRLFQLGRPGYSEVSVLPLRVAVNQDAVLQAYTTLSDLHEDCLCNRIRPGAITNFLKSMFALTRRDLGEIVVNSKFEFLISFMLNCCRSLSHEEFKEFLFHLSVLKYKINIVRMSKQVKRCVDALDQESLKRTSHWQMKELLKVSDALSLVGKGSSSVMGHVFEMLGDTSANLTREETIQAAYLAGEIREVPEKVMANLESRILELLKCKDISFVELGTVCTAFFKSKYNNCSHEFMNSLRDALFEADLPEQPSYHIVGILKVFRYNYYGYSTLFETVGDQISREAFRYPVKSIMQLVLTFATLHILHKDLMDAAAEEVVAKIRRCRSKDVAKFMWSFATMNYKPKNWEHVLDLLQRRAEELRDEMERFPIQYISFLLSLAYMNVYPTEPLNVIFNDHFLQCIKDYEEREGMDLRSNLYMLDSSATLECPTILENRLNLDYMTAKPFPHHMLGDAEEELKQRKELREVADGVKSIVGGDRYCRVQCILPYMRAADIVVYLDETNTPIPLSNGPEWGDGSSGSVLLSDDIILHLTGEKRNLTESFPSHLKAPKSISRSDSRRKLNKEKNEGRLNEIDERLKQVQLPQKLSILPNERRIAIQVSSRNHHHFGGKQLLGLHNMKRRQLTRLGYHVVDIPYHDWELVGRSGPAAKKHYLKQKIFGPP